MSLLKDTGSFFKNISDKIVDGTEKYSKIARFAVDIKRAEDDIEKAHTKIGEYVAKKIEGGDTTINVNDHSIQEQLEKIKVYTNSIKSKREEIEEAKKIGQQNKDEQNNQESEETNQDQDT